MGRLSKAASRRRADRFGINSKTMADLERAAIVVPFGDKAKGQLSYATSGTEETKTYQSGQAQTEAALPIC